MDTGAEPDTRISRQHPQSFDEEAIEAGVTSRVPLGVRPIRVRRIVGSAGKADAIGRDFLPPRPGRRRTSYHDILRRMQGGETLPPITVYQLGTRFFVIDGHTRVAAAMALDVEFIDAEVIEVLPRKEGEADLTYYARRAFERATGLESIRLTAPWRYSLLQEHVEGYRLYLERSLEPNVSLPDVARVWYRTQYLPTISEIYRRKLLSTSGGHTGGDVYTDVLKAWSEVEGAVVSLREMLDRYDESLPRGLLQRVERRVAAAVDAGPPEGGSFTYYAASSQVDGPRCEG